MSAAEAKAQAQRDKLLAQLRAAKAGGNVEKKLALKWNMMMPSRNVELFPPPPQSAIPILLLTYKRTMYLEAALRLYSVVRGINSTTLVTSHQGTDKAVWGLVERIDFCRVKQLIFPYRHGVRGPLALKLHFAWAVGQVFAQLESSELLYMEDDYWPTPDLYLSALWLQAPGRYTTAQREQHCPECFGGIVGDHPRDWTERHTDGRSWLGGEKLRWLHRPYVSCNFNSPAGISMPLRSWRALTKEPSGFCDQTIPAYDDAIHALQNELPDRKRVVEPGWLALAYPRCLHIGRCEGLSFRAERLGEEAAAEACNATADLATFMETWVAPWLEPDGALADLSSVRPPSVAKYPRTAWHIAEGLATCRARYVPDEQTGKLAGVAVTNHTLPKKLAELCTGILKYTEGA